MKELMIANFLQKPKSSVFDLLKPDAEARYIQRRARIESLTYCFLDECDVIFGWLESKGEKFSNLFTGQNGKPPIIVEMAVQNGKARHRAPANG
jgi:hypothetical protein